MEEVEFEAVRIPGKDDQVDVEFNVKEQPSGSFNAGISYGDQTKLGLQAGIQQDNFLGTGKRIGINLSTVSYQKQAQLSYTDPFFTIDGISLGGTVSYSEFDGSSFNVIQYNSKRWSVGGTIGYPIDEFNRISFGLTYSDIELSNRGYYEQTNRFYEQFTNEDNPDAPIEYTSLQASLAWSRSTLNRGLFPTAGSSQRASFSITTPNSDVNYFKTVYDARFYFPVSRDQRWSFLTKLRLGYGNGYGDINGSDQILPFNENFTAGGADTLRGFENNTVGPRGIQRSSSGNTITLPDGTIIPGDPSNDSYLLSRRSLGGNAMALGGIELIVPTPFVEEDSSNSVRTSMFVDVGNVWDTEFDYEEYSRLTNAGGNELLDFSDWSLFRSSAGISVQWISPMGPMVFSFSKALKEREGDDAKFFTFNIGQTF